MRRQSCAFVVRMWHKQVFSWRGSNCKKNSHSVCSYRLCLWNVFEEVLLSWISLNLCLYPGFSEEERWVVVGQRQYFHRGHWAGTSEGSYQGRRSLENITANNDKERRSLETFQPIVIKEGRLWKTLQPIVIKESGLWKSLQPIVIKEGGLNSSKNLIDV